jgi:hypothetical protein
MTMLVESVELTHGARLLTVRETEVPVVFQVQDPLEIFLLFK